MGWNKESWANPSIGTRYAATSQGTHCEECGTKTKQLYRPKDSRKVYCGKCIDSVVARRTPA